MFNSSEIYIKTLSPYNIIKSFLKKQQNKKHYSPKHKEGFITSVFVLYLNKAHPNSYFIEINRDDPPDTRIYYFSGRNSIDYLEVEIVTYSEFRKKEKLDKFLRRTKLSKFYPDGTIILIYTENQIKVAEIERITKKIPTKFNLDIFLIGSVQIGSEFIYKVSKIYPYVEESLTFDFTELRNLPNKRNKFLEIKKGTRIGITNLG